MHIRGVDAKQKEPGMIGRTSTLKLSRAEIDSVGDDLVAKAAANRDPAPIVRTQLVMGVDRDDPGYSDDWNEPTREIHWPTGTDVHAEVTEETIDSYAWAKERLRIGREQRVALGVLAIIGESVKIGENARQLVRDEGQAAADRWLLGYITGGEFAAMDSWWHRLTLVSPWAAQ
jgi:hypothetical protein